MSKAFLFDLNGTMIDDMHYHLDVWYHVLVHQLGATLSREEVRSHMYGKNGELLDRVFGPGSFTEEEVARISHDKEVQYQAIYQPHLHLIEGLPAVLARAKSNQVKMAIGSAAIPFNIDFVLDNLNIRHYFDAIVSADDVTLSKPHPEVFLKGAHLLHTAPSDCVVFEDAPKGVEAAHRAGMKAVAITTLHTPEEFGDLSNILFFIKDYTDPRLATLF
ncbi:MAG: haloacid dehalogenase [Azospira oryzae]|jgi:beta-phosphoglucomutase|nr:MAG: haloacid dehalogenase [Azospira oryzae]